MILAPLTVNNDSVGIGELITDPSPTLIGDWVQKAYKPPQFLGNDTHKSKFPLWQERFKIFLSKKGLGDILEQENLCATKNKLLYADIVDAVDDISLGLILNDDARNDGQRAYKILCNYYLGSQKSRKINTLKELISVTLLSNETIIQFTCRIDRMRDTLALYNVKDDDIIITCVLRGLPRRFDTFCTIVNSVEDFPSWEIFKLRLHSFADSKIFSDRNNSGSNIIMSVRDGSHNVEAGGQHTGAISKHGAGQTHRPAPNDPGNNHSRPTIHKPKLNKYKKEGKSLKKCTKCLGRSHKTEDCRSVKYCNTCKNRSHDSENCFKNKQSGYAGRGPRGNQH